MKKANLLSKREMKKVTGGDPGSGGLCTPAIYCMSPWNTLVYKVGVPDCESQSVFGTCYFWPNPNDIAIDLSYCDACD